MERSTTSTLVKLSDTELTVADPADDVRGRTVVDRYGDEVGEVASLLIDTHERKVRFLEVASGGFLGLGGETRLVPVDAVTSIADDAVHIDETREQVHGSPAYDPHLAIDRSYYEDVYGYYGYPPYWSAGYAYPGYPYLR